MDASCLFVRNLTKDTTREELTQLFSADYVIKHAIIIHERHGGPSKGFGFVTFALESDAREALERDNFSLKGNKLKLALAANPGKRQEQEQQGEEASATNAATPAPAAAAQVVDWKARKDERRKTAEMLERERRTIVLFGLRNLTDHQLRKRLKKRAGGTVEQIENWKEGDDSIKTVVYQTADAVNGAVKEINGRSWGSNNDEGSDEAGGGVVYARRYNQVALTPHQRSKSRLICRNLAFTVTEAEVLREFAKYGPVEEIVVNAKGFGFVQFYCRTDAERAMEAVNGTDVLGPVKPSGKRGRVAVDFALTKDHYEKLKSKQEQEEEKQAEEEEEAAEEESEEEEEAAEDEEESEEEAAEESGQEEDESEQEEDEEEEEAPAAQNSAAATGDRGVREKRTLFVRNLLFETTEETLRERFKEFGKVRGVKLCRDATQRSRGMGFVEFWDAESCNKVLSSMTKSSGGSGTASLLLEGRELYCNLAVDKTQAEGMRETASASTGKNSNKKEDKRHLHLIKVSRVPASSVPRVDQKKREFLEEETKTKLRNPLFYVSETRLSVKNLCRKPSETPDSKTLRSVFKACAIRGLKERLVVEPPPRTSVRVLKATVFQEEGGAGGKQDQGTGFGFVEMSSHAHALAALKVLNNNPEFSYLASGGSQAMKMPEDVRPRLIVSFAIENGAKVRAQKLRQASGKERAPAAVDNTAVPVKRARTTASEEGEAARANKPVKKVREHLTSKAAPVKQQQKEEVLMEGGERENVMTKKRASRPKPMTNRAFERANNSARNTDELDQIMSKRARLFDEPESASAAAGEHETKKKRWFEE